MLLGDKSAKLNRGIKGLNFGKVKMGVVSYIKVFGARMITNQVNRPDLVRVIPSLAIMTNRTEFRQSCINQIM